MSESLLDLLITVSIDDKASKQVDSTSSNVISKLGSAASTAGKVASKIGSAFTSAYSTAQGAVGGLTGAIGTLAATGGISRALSIEAAEAKLTGLGHTGDELTAIMANCSAAVTGTSYGLGEAATAAGVLAAAGVEAGDGLNDMQGVLSTVASVATVSGREFGEISSIFGKVAAYGKLTTETMQQLMDSGIPVLSMLAEHYGVTTEAMQEMVTAGEVDFATFNEVMNENMGEAAQVCGQTFPAALKNLKAALSKIGAAAATPALESLRQIILALNKVINDFVPTANELGAALSDKLAGPTQRAIDFISRLHEALSGGLVSGFGEVSPAVVAAGAAFAAFASGGIVSLLSQIPVLGGMLGSFSGIVGALGSPIGVVVVALLALGAASGTLQEAFGPVIEDLAGKLPGAFETVAGWADRLGTAFEPVLSAFFGLAAAVVPLVESLVSGLGEGISSFVVPALESVAPVLATLMENMATLATQLQPVAELLGVGIAVAATAVIEIFGILATVINDVIALVVAVVADAQESFAAAPEVFGNFVNTVSSWMGQLPGIVGGFLASVISGVVSWVANMITNAATAGSNFVSTVVGFISALPGNIASFLSSIISNVASWVGQMASNAASAASGFASNLINGLASIPGQVYSIGTQIIQGIANGITGAAGTVVSAISGAVGDAISTAKSLLGIASPSKVFKRFGKFTMEGFAVGVAQTADSAVSAVSGVMDTVQGAFDGFKYPTGTIGTVGAVLAAASAGAAAGGSATTNNFTINVNGGNGDPRDIADAVIDAINDLFPTGVM